MTTWYRAPAPVARRVRAYLAPVNRATATPTLFDPSEQGGFSLNNPPSPWISLGWIQDFNRKSGSKTSAVLSGIPASALEQVRETVQAQVGLQFLNFALIHRRSPSHATIAGASLCHERPGPASAREGLSVR